MKCRHRFPSEWSSVNDLNLRSLGIGTTKQFQNSAHSASARVECLIQTDSLDYHDGCVNALNYNPSGSLILSGSDDLQVAIWDWLKYTSKPKLTYNSGHSSNVFQTKFMPHTCDSTIVTCARDGQVRVGFISSVDRLQQQTKRVAQHKGSAHKLSIEPGSPNLLKTVGEDAVAFNIDLRESKPTKLFTLHNEKNRRVALYTVHINPLKPEEFAVGGRDNWARIFDTRMINQERENGYIKRFCPGHIKGTHGISSPNVTCLTYNYNGTELLLSYNDEDIYLFDAIHSSESNPVHLYKGHRNSDTVKGVNFFGACSEYIISGSDCSHVYIWNKKTEEIVTFLKGDTVGVVNVLEPHPHYCVLATAGLDHDIKIWQPVGEPFAKQDDLEKQIKINADAREEDKQRGPDMYDTQLVYLMMRHLQRQRRRLQRQNRQEDPDENSALDDDVDDETTSDSDSNDMMDFPLTDSSDVEHEDNDDNDDDGGSQPSQAVNCVQS